jgi:hypothetical protein
MSIEVTALIGSVVHDVPPALRVEALIGSVVHDVPPAIRVNSLIGSIVHDVPAAIRVHTLIGSIVHDFSAVPPAPADIARLSGYEAKPTLLTPRYLSGWTLNTDGDS